jgi:NAD(P)-dependent dehydrogenase (short-subunit alcohol dehydrogenase family)
LPIYTRALDRSTGLATCAGIVDAHDFFELSAATFRRVYDVNVCGTFSCIKAAARRMSPGARIVTVSSIAGVRGGGLFGTAAYAASKGAVLALTKSAARALGGRNIAVNCVAPGPADTAMTGPLFADAARRATVSDLTALGRCERDCGSHRLAAVSGCLIRERRDFGRRRRHRHDVSRGSISAIFLSGVRPADRPSLPERCGCRWPAACSPDRGSPPRRSPPVCRSWTVLSRRRA